MDWHQYKAWLASHHKQFVVKIPCDVRQFNDNVNTEHLQNDLWHLHKQLCYAIDLAEKNAYTGNKLKKHANLLLWTFKHLRQIERQIRNANGELCSRLNNYGWLGALHSCAYSDIKRYKQNEIAERLLAYYLHCYTTNSYVSYNELCDVLNEVESLTGIDTNDIRFELNKAINRIIECK